MELEHFFYIFVTCMFKIFLIEFLLLKSFWLYQCGVRNAYFLSYNCFEFLNLGLGHPVQSQPLVSFFSDRISIGDQLGIDWESIGNQSGSYWN